MLSLVPPPGQVGNTGPNAIVIDSITVSLNVAGTAVGSDARIVLSDDQNSTNIGLDSVAINTCRSWHFPFPTGLRLRWTQNNTETAPSVSVNLGGGVCNTNGARLIVLYHYETL